MTSWQNISQTVNNQFNDKIKTIDKMKLVLNELNPKTALKRGYAIINGVLDSGKIIKIETFDKLITAEVKDVKRK